MNNPVTDPGSCDSVRKPWQAFSLWVLPGVVAAAALFCADRHPTSFLAAGAALVVMGSACLVNAARCQRLHCYLTGPYFLLLALGAILAYQFDPGAVHHSREWLLLALGVAPLLIWLPERIAGKKYRNTPSCGGDSQECR